MADRVYAAEPAPGPIETALAGKTPLECAILRATAHRNLPTAGDDFVLDGYQVQLTGNIRPFADGRGIEMDFRARVAATGELLPMDNPYRFVNPPVKVPNGTWRVLADSTEVENTEENVRSAMKRIVLDAILLRARQLGWTG